MHSNSFMPCSLLTSYISEIEERPHSVYPSLSSSMIVVHFLCLFIAVIILGDQEPYYIPHDYYDFWMVVGRNSSGQLYFNPASKSRRVFIWKPYNASIPPTLFFEDHPEILQDNLSTTSSRISAGIASANVSITSPATLEEVTETIPPKRPSGHFSTSTPTTAALKIHLPGKKERNATTSQPGMNLLQLHETLRHAKLASKLNRQQDALNLTLPQSRNDTHELPSPSTDKIVYAKDEISLTKERSRLSYIRKAKLRVKRQISPDVY